MHTCAYLRRIFMATIKDIARLAGVSHSTVSRALNGNPSIPESTRERIRLIAEENDFEINVNARGLNSSKTGVIGVILPDLFGDINCETFLSSLLGKLIRSLEKDKYSVRTDFSKIGDSGKSNIKKLINSNAVDGLIIIHHTISLQDLTHIKNSKTPYIFLHYKPENTNPELHNYCYTNHFTGGYLAGKYLIDNGHKHIVHFSINKNTHEAIDRTKGFIKAAEEANIQYNILRGALNFESGFNSTKANLPLFKEATGIFAATDMLALGAAQSLKENRFIIPDDISIIGYDDMDYSKFAVPPLTTIHQPLFELAEKAAEKIIEQIIEEKYCPDKYKITIPPYIIERKSVKKLN